MSLHVTVVDEHTGQTEVQRVAEGSYLLVAAPPCRLVHGSRNGTAALLSIDGYAPRPLDPDPPFPIERPVSAGALAVVHRRARHG